MSFSTRQRWPVQWSLGFSLSLAGLLGVFPIWAIAEELGHSLQEVSTSSAVAEDSTSAKQDAGILEADFDNSPTFVKADSLILRSQKRTFVYEGNVEVIHGDMTLTCQILDAFYNEQNQIEQLIARENVVIVKGEGIRATSERAVYERASETMTLTENPEIQQDGSLLTADLVRIFLQEDRSTAEGQVRVKLVEKPEEEDASKKKPAKKAEEK